MAPSCGERGCVAVVRSFLRATCPRQSRAARLPSRCLRPDAGQHRRRIERQRYPRPAHLRFLRDRHARAIRSTRASSPRFSIAKASQAPPISGRKARRTPRDGGSASTPSQHVNNKLSESTKGVATRTGRSHDTVAVELEKPKRGTLTLSGNIYFPNTALSHPSEGGARRPNPFAGRYLRWLRERHESVRDDNGDRRAAGACRQHAIACR